MRRILSISIAALGLCAAASAQTRRALVLGIDLYQPLGTQAHHEAGCTYGRCELASFENLNGAVNDAQSMADLLTSPKFGFAADKVVLLTNPGARRARPGVVVLPAEQTTHDGILAAMRKYLVEIPQRGDTVVFYDASHGSLRVNTAGEKLTVRGEDGKLVHVDSTLVPSDAYRGVYDIRDRELTRIFNAALDKGVHLTVIFDSCHSGGSTRGLGAGLRKRALPYDPRPVYDPPETGATGQRTVPPTERSENPALVFAAAQQDQAANEADPSAALPEAHGAFTAALIEALEALPAGAPSALVYQRVKAILEGQGVPQEPDLDATAARRAQPLFGGATGDDAGKVRAAALKMDDFGNVWLDIGMVSGIGPGSEFTAMVPNAQGQRIVLRADKPLGISRTSAKVAAPEGATVRPGDVFELSRLVPEPANALRVWLGPAGLSAADLAAAVAEVKASGVGTVADPADEAYTDVLSWTGTVWTLAHASARSEPQVMGRSAAPAPVELGATLTGRALKRALPPQAKLWVDLPATQELAAALTWNDPESAAQTTADPAQANYILAGSLVKGVPSYTWFHKSELEAGPHATTRDHSPGCSTTSPYPVRSDWVGAAGGKASADALLAAALRLAKVHGWLQLADNASAGASEANYYKLVLLPMAGTATIDTQRTSVESDRMRLALQAEGAVKEPRWVYVLDIDCHGKGSLIYPLNNSENQYPSQGDHDSQIVLRNAPVLKVGPPFGVDTLILLSTAQPLPDPSVLNFEGAARGGARGAGSPLQRLLSNASSGSRGLGAESELPTTWGIDVTLLRSAPKEPAH